MKKILCFSYAFPPMKVPMSPAVFKGMSGFKSHGYEIDVLCAEDIGPYAAFDQSLIEYFDKFANITYLKMPRDIISRIKMHYPRLARIPDFAYILQKHALKALLTMDLARYEAIITWSPFHSVNYVMLKLKKRYPKIKWIAQFSDPWANNPLEFNKIINLWNTYYEALTVKSADYLIFTSPYSRNLMLRNFDKSFFDKTAIIPHSYDLDLYPKRPKKKNDKIIIRHIGQLYGRRSPEIFFQALLKVIEREPDLANKLKLELVGTISQEMLNSSTALSIPKGIVSHVPDIDYVTSLELIYDTDILLLIDANVRENLFLPSKLADYLGSNNAIFAITPNGTTKDFLKTVKCIQATPTDDINEIAEKLSFMIHNFKDYANYNDTPSQNHNIARKIIEIIEKI